MALGFGTNTQVVVPGTYVYTPPAGTICAGRNRSSDGNIHSRQYAGYTSASGDQLHSRDQGDAHPQLANPGSDCARHAAEQHPARCHRDVPGRDLSPGHTLTLFHQPPRPAHGAVLAAGTHTLQVVFTPTDTTDFTTATATVQIVVGTTGSTGVSGSPVFSSGDCCFFSQPTPYTITVSGSTAAPTGTVNVVFNGQTLATGTLTPGSGASSSVTLNLISSYFVPGNNTVTLNYLGDTTTSQAVGSAVIPLRNPAIGAEPCDCGRWHQYDSGALHLPCGRSHDLQLQPGRRRRLRLQQNGRDHLRVWSTGNLRARFAS